MSNSKSENWWLMSKNTHRDITCAVYSDVASYYWVALLLGLVSGETVVAWAEEVLANDENAPDEFSMIALVAPGEVTALRYALLELCSESVSEKVQISILGSILKASESGKRSFSDTVTVLSQFRRFVKIAPLFANYITSVELHHSQIDVNDRERMASLGHEVYTWLRDVSN